jgi:hypothetical protein
MALRAILLVALTILFFAGVACADDTSKLAGSIIKAEDALAKSDAVLVGVIADMGFKETPPTTAPSSGPTYDNVKVGVLQTFRGPAPGKIIFSTIFTAALHGERLPIVGTSYIFFLRKVAAGSPDPYFAIKLLLATSDNIATVKKLIAQLHAK